MSEIQIIIPTYNAKETIVETIVQIRAVVKNAKIIIVDDNSPDKTAKLVQTKFKKDFHVTVKIRQRKGGRGSAVIDGFKVGLRDKNAKYFIEMDGDLCHDPKYIPKMIALCQKADVVIVSKYLKGSTISGLSFIRRILSIIMNKAAKRILQVPISDYSNGYRCYKRSVISFLVSQKLISKGFVSLSENILLIHKKGYTITEIPFDFKQQNLAKSNMNVSEIVQAIITLFRLRLQYNKEQ